MESLFSLFLLLLPPPSWLYSLHSCSIDSNDPGIIDCYNKNLSKIPTDIPKSAVYLEFFLNNIESIQQIDFSGLTELQTLDLSFNQISHIENETFSPLLSLTELRLNLNRLTALTDLMFTGLSNLTVLLLSGNKITSISEFAFATLTNLQELDLSSNALTRVAMNIALCLSLTSLDLSDNPLTSLESEQFPFPLNITNLSLGFTLSRFSLHSDLFPHLQTLLLSSIDTDLQWDVSDKVFLTSLRNLDLSGTNFSDVTYERIFQSLDSLESLHFSEVASLLDRGLLDWACGIQTLQTLTLLVNKISVLNESLLLPCSNLTELDLSYNALTDLAPSSLRMWTRLSRLNLEWNGLTKVPLTIRNMSSLTFLSLQFNHIRKLSCLDFSGLHLLKVLDLSSNKISELNSCVFQDLQSLQELNIDNNYIIDFHDSFGIILPNMLVLKAKDNPMQIFQKGVFRNMANLTDLGLSGYVKEGAFDGLRDLRNLSINMYHPPTAGVELLSSPRGRSIFNLPSLQTFSLTITSFDCLNLAQDFFQGLDDLKVLSLTGCFQKYSNNSKIFQYMPRLLKIEISGSLEWLRDPELYQPLTDLQTLDLSENHLKSVDFLSEANLTQLQTLILTSNDLCVINERVFEALPSLRYLDLSDNRFVCDCSNADFILWAVSNKRVYVNGTFQYRCVSPESHRGALLLEFIVRWCWESVGFTCFICSSALVLLTLFSTFLHHFLRFHLLYGFYLLRAFRYDRQKRRKGCEEIYDAFVSYNVHDEEWVYRELVPELEGRQGWKLCLHHRDFELGKTILDNITDAIYSSRKTLCVISHQYLLSEWCSREIQMASYRLLDEQKDVLILLILEELSANQLSPFFRMRKLLRSRTYLSWTGTQDRTRDRTQDRTRDRTRDRTQDRTQDRTPGHRGLFWERVRQALQSGARLETDPLPTGDRPTGDRPTGDRPTGD